MKRLVLAAGCAALVAGCGGSKAPSSRQAGINAGLKFAQCMRAHGITNFPDPSSGGGGGIKIQLGSGLDPASPSFQSAQRACRKDLPGGPFRGKATVAQKKHMLELSQCMRAHGLANFPDPVSSPPAPGSGFGLAFGAPGAFLAIPQSMVNSPAFKQAAAACHLPGAGRGKPAAASR